MKNQFTKLIYLFLLPAFLVCAEGDTIVLDRPTQPESTYDAKINEYESPVGKELELANDIAGGPTQPEFAVASSSQPGHRVDPFTGDFSYTVQMGDVGGYPLTITYASGRKMDEEASMVGLGWNFNLGAINRIVSGIPDDFNGDELTYKTHKAGYTEISFGKNVGIGEIYGYDGVNASLGYDIYYNSKFGFSTGIGAALNLDALVPFGKTGLKAGAGIGANLALNSAGDNGFDVTLQAKIKYENKDEKTGDVKDKASLKLKYSFKKEAFKIEQELKYKGLDIKIPNMYNKPKTYSLPSDRLLFSHFSSGINYQHGIELQGWTPGVGYNGSITTSSNVNSNDRQIKAYGIANLQHAELNGMMDFQRYSGDNPDPKNPYVAAATLTSDIYTVQGIGESSVFKIFRNDFGVTHDPQKEVGTGGYLSVGIETAQGAKLKVGADLSVTKNYATYGCSSEEFLTGVDEHNPDAVTDFFLKYKFLDKANPNLPLDFEPWVFKELYDKGGVQGLDELKKITGDNNSDKKISYAVRPNVRDNYTPDIMLETSTNNSVVLNANTLPSYKAERANAGKLLRSYDLFDCITSGTFNHIESIKIKGINYANDLLVSEQTEFRRFKWEYQANSRGIKKAHHNWEMQLIKDEGSRYVYSTPVYANTSEEYAFSLKSLGINLPGNKMILNDFESIIREEKGGGIDEFFDKKINPAHANTYLLNSIVSSDYVDLSGNGPSPDDGGVYTLFHYTRTSEKYSWRIPYEKNSVIYNENVIEENALLPSGFDSRSDDVGNFIYGERELWYPSSIESKSFEAHFYYSPRKDGIGVRDKIGGMNINLIREYFNDPQACSARAFKEAMRSCQMKLDSIIIVSKINPENRLKKIGFEYDYSLCRGVSDNIDNYVGENFIPATDPKKGGKLTLLRVWIENEQSEKGALSDYQFRYGQFISPSRNEIALSNPQYNASAQDNWGHYRHPNTYMHGNTLDDYSYASQGNTYEAEEAAAWNLTSVLSPSGSKLEIRYERDEYAFVQDKESMLMTPILGLGSSAEDWGSSYWINDINDLDSKDYLNRNYLYFKIPKELRVTTGSEDEKKQATLKMLQACFYDVKNLLASFEIKVASARNTQIQVPVWWKIHVDTVNGIYRPDVPTDFREALFYAVNDSVAWLNLGFAAGREYPSLYKEPSLKDYGEIRLAAYKEAIQQIPWILHYNPDLDPTRLLGDPIETVLYMVELATDVFHQLDAAFRSESFASYMQAQDLCQTLVPTYDPMRERFGTNNHSLHSYLRIKNPIGFKKGDGVRVKKLLVSDNWRFQRNNSFGEFYGVEYEYTTSEMYAGEMRTISSGVIVDESSSTMHESPLVSPLWDATTKSSREDQISAFYKPEYNQVIAPLNANKPSGGVGYSRVKIKQVNTAAATRNTKRYAVNTFYTCKEFPYYEDHTAPELKSNAKDFWTILAGAFGANIINQCVSQGYTFVTNNMHGKLKSTGDYVEQNGIETPVSQQVNYYKLPRSTYGDRINLVKPDGSAIEEAIGINYELFFDYRYFCEKSIVGGIKPNLDLIFFPLPPLLPVPTLYPILGYSQVTNKSIVANNYIYLSGILDSTVITGPGINAVERTIALDQTTGEILVTNRSDEYSKPVFTTQIPAYWQYDRMGPAYSNDGLLIPVKSMTPKINGIEVGLGYTSSTSDSNYEIKLGALLHKIKAGDEIRFVYKEQNTERQVRPYWVLDIILNSKSIRIIDKNGDLLTTALSPMPDYIKIVHSANKNLQGVTMGEVVSLVSPISNNRIVLNAEKLIVKANASEFSENWQTDKTSYFIDPQTNCNNCKDVIKDDKLHWLHQLLGKIRNKTIAMLTTEAPFEITGAAEEPYEIITSYNENNQLIFRITGKVSRRYIGKLTLQLTANFKINETISKIRYIDGGNCENTNQMTLDFEYLSGFETFQTNQLTITGISDGFQTVECNYNSQLPDNARYICDLNSSGRRYNPFVNGTRGIWRLKRSWFYDGERDYQLGFYSGNRISEIKTQGTFKTFIPFWNCSAFSNNSTNNWTYANSFEKINYNGKVFEQRDISGMPSADLFGYGNHMVKATCTNAAYRNIAFENFEDWETENYNATSTPGFRCKPNNHWFDVKELINRNQGVLRPEIGISNHGHTGQKSLAIHSIRNLEISTPISAVIPSSSTSVALNIIQPKDIIEKFNPEKGKKYQASLWIQVNRYVEFEDGVYDVYKNAFRIYINDQELSTRSTIINGWQQVSGIIELRNSATTFTLKISNNHSNGILVDDIRIHPEESTMIAYVYDPEKLRLVAELDNFNFASFVQYNSEGKPVRSKIETEKGIITVSETHSSSRKRKRAE